MFHPFDARYYRIQRRCLVGRELRHAEVKAPQLFLLFDLHATFLARHIGQCVVPAERRRDMQESQGTIFQRLVQF